MKKKKIIKIVIPIILIIISLLGGTLAWYIWSTSNGDEVQVLTGLEAASVIYTEGSNITGRRLKPTATKGEGIVKNITIYTKEEVHYTLKFNLYLDIITLPEGLKDVSFKYALYKDSTILVKDGSFTDDYLSSNLVECTTNSTNHIVLLTDEVFTSTPSRYTLYIWIDGNLPNSSAMQEQNFVFKLHADGYNAILAPTAAEYITNLYTRANKTPVVNNSITYNYANIYDIDDDSTTSGGLMNDRLGGTTTDLDAGNIRYYGKSPNNYIYFNCSDYANQSDTTCEKWRIIGVFDGKVKIIRNGSIGSYSWDNKNTSTGAESANGKNDWTTARLMKLLNPSDYYEVDENDNGLGQSLYYTGGSGTCYSGQNNATKTCDFTSTGLKNDTTRNMIEEVTWNLGGWNSASVYSNQIYSYERGTTVYPGMPTTWTGKIALPYPSDYGYATDFTKCSQNLIGYDISTGSYACRTNDWLYNGAYQWLLTPNSFFSYNVWYVLSSGYAYNVDRVYFVNKVRPVLYLNSKLTIESGNGSTSNPYRLSVS